MSWYGFNCRNCQNSLTLSLPIGLKLWKNVSSPWLLVTKTFHSLSFGTSILFLLFHYHCHFIFWDLLHCKIPNWFSYFQTSLRYWRQMILSCMLVLPCQCSLWNNYHIKSRAGPISGSCRHRAYSILSSPFFKNKSCSLFNRPFFSQSNKQGTALCTSTHIVPFAQRALPIPGLFPHIHPAFFIKLWPHQVLWSCFTSSYAFS